MQWDVQSIITALLGALGGGTLTSIFKQVWDWSTGKQGRRRNEVDRAYAQRDKEARKRRILEESLSVHRRVILEAGCLSQDDLPPYPVLTETHHNNSTKEASDD